MYEPAVEGSGAGMYLLPLLAVFADGSPGESLMKTASASFVSGTSSIQAQISASMRCAPFGILDIFRIDASAAPQSFFVECSAHLPIEPIRVETIDAHSLLDPIDRFIGSANPEKQIRTVDEDHGEPRRASRCQWRCVSVLLRMSMKAVDTGSPHVISVSRLVS